MPEVAALPARRGLGHVVERPETDRDRHLERAPHLRLDVEKVDAPPRRPNTRATTSPRPVIRPLV